MGAVTADFEAGYNDVEMAVTLDLAFQLVPRLLNLCLAFFVLLTVVGLASLYTFRSRFQEAPADGNMTSLQHSSERGTH